MKERFARYGSSIRHIAGTALCLALNGLITGCASGPTSAANHPRPLPPSAFYGPSSTVVQTPSDQVQQPSVVANEPHLTLPVIDPPPVLPPASVSNAAPPLNLDPPASTQASPASPARGSASAPPTTGPAIGTSMGEYVIYGGVLAIVNGQPIYADKVLNRLENSLKGEAKQLGPREFAAVARDKIKQEVDVEIMNELRFLDADRYLGDNEKQLADHLTMKWRDDQIVAAGGSLELARKRFAAEDQNFDEEVHQQYRHVMISIYMQKRVSPKIQISADDMRQYYKQNQEQLYTQHDKALFRLIKVDIAKSHGHGEAELKARQIHNLAVTGEDFATLAASTQYNDDPNLRLTKGLVVGEKDMVQRGSFKLEKVEQAIWLTGAGHITDVVTDGDALYIAKVEKLEHGETKAFEDSRVQDSIYNTLHSAQFSALSYTLSDSMVRRAEVTSDNQAMNLAIDMAMQKYLRWTAH